MSSKKKKRIPQILRIAAMGMVACIVCVAITLFVYEKRYANRVYPNVSVGEIAFGGKTKDEVALYWKARNQPFATAQFELKFDSHIATFSGSDIDLGYDAEFSANQAYMVGRSGGMLSNFIIKFFQKRVNLTPYFRWKEGVTEDILEAISERVDVPTEDALFQFTNNKVTAFRASTDGRQLNKDEARERIKQAFLIVAKTNQQHITVMLPVETIHPLISTNSVNSFGIRELIGRGYSEFTGSIAGRIHNVALAASRLNGVLIKPGDVFSFNTVLGDISAATGYQSAYIIKEGRTVLGDGGGVCQVSSTLFRAALDAGLPIIERHAHAYRVHYYEEGGYKPGLDATVFAPSVDLKFKNDTPTYILIQARTDTRNLHLTFELYGSKDGRVSEIFNHKVWDQSPPPEPLYQDDPTIPKGVTKQVDWAAWGAKASFQYRVTRGGEVLQNTTFYSNFRPWQAVYLVGTQ
jgi:vancomycin resistance protein YoaR